MEETLSLNKILDVLKKRMLLIFSLIIGAAVISGLVSYYVITPTYQSSSQFIVNQTSQTDGQQVYDVNQIRSNVEIINTYNVVIKSAAILDQVSQDINAAYTAEQLSDKLAVSSAEDSQVVTVTATDPDPQLAASIANTTVSVFQGKITDLMNVNNVSILSSAEVAADPQPVNPKPVLNIVIAIVLGGMFGIGIAFLLEYLDSTVNADSEVEDKLGLPVLGVISRVSEKDLKAAGRVKSVKPETIQEGGEFHGPAKKTV